MSEIISTKTRKSDAGRCVGPQVYVGVQMPKPLADALDARVKIDDATRSSVMRRALRVFLNFPAPDRDGSERTSA